MGIYAFRHSAIRLAAKSCGLLILGGMPFDWSPAVMQQVGQAATKGDLSPPPQSSDNNSRNP